MAHLGKIVSLPRPASTGASRSDILRGRVREMIGRVLNRLKIPGAVKDVHFKDVLTGQEIDIHVGVLFTRISVNGRDYFFHRTNGKIDGTGMGCS